MIRCRASNLNNRPPANHLNRSLDVRLRPPNDEVIVPVNQDSNRMTWRNHDLRRRLLRFRLRFFVNTLNWSNT